MSIAINEGEGYVVISLLPIEQQISFKKWISTQTVPTIPAQGIYQNNCAYLHDYNYRRWLSAWKKGEASIILD